jgi:heme exporter protein A
MTPQPLEVRDLAVARGGRPVLAGVSFTVAPGRSLILRGPNGAGKTTLLRTLAGLQPPVAGQIAGGDAVAYAGHADGVKSMLSVAENLAFWARIYRSRNSISPLDSFKIGDLKDVLAGTLSAGQRRRVGLARLLVTGCPIWALDEPTVSLDAEAVATFGSVLRAHLSGGGTAVMATHIDLGLPEAEVLDVTRYRAAAAAMETADEAFL